MPYRGLIHPDMSPNPEELVVALQSVTVPALRSWRAIKSPARSFVWQVRPPGTWVVLMRLDERLVTSDASIPLDVDYEAVFEMLSAHRAALLCRVDSVVGLIGMAVGQPGASFTPLVPGFQGTSSRLILPTTAEVVAEAADPPWPEGLMKPSTIGIQSAHSLQLPEHRIDWLRKCPEGVWLLGFDGAELEIFEVLS